MSKNKPKVKTYLFLMEPHSAESVSHQQIKGVTPYDALINAELFSNDKRNLDRCYLRKKDVVRISDGVYSIEDGSDTVMMLIKL